jgi:Flp pilus assembly protein TadG
MSQVRHRATEVPRRALFHRQLGERGAVAVEAAIIFPLLVVLTFGIIEFSLLMRDVTATASVVRAGARTASALPRQTTMLTATVDSMKKAGSAMPQDSYDELWIYKANATGFPGAYTSMTGATCSTSCVKYRWNDAANTFVAVGGSWDMMSINACPGDAAAESVGVYLKADHKWLTGLFFDQTSISDRAVLKFEPIVDYSAANPCRR